jgi:hypothetical protein
MLVMTMRGRRAATNTIVKHPHEIQIYELSFQDHGAI